MFGIGGTELIIILVFAFLIFGPDKLPDLATTVRKFQDTRSEVTKVVKEDVIDLNDEENPIKDPTKAVDKLSNIARETLKDVSESSEDLAKLKNATQTGGRNISKIAEKALADKESEGGAKSAEPARPKAAKSSEAAKSSKAAKAQGSKSGKSSKALASKADKAAKSRKAAKTQGSKSGKSSKAQASKSNLTAKAHARNASKDTKNLASKAGKGAKSKDASGAKGKA